MTHDAKPSRLGTRFGPAQALALLEQMVRNQTTNGTNSD